MADRRNRGGLLCNIIPRSYLLSYLLSATYYSYTLLLKYLQEVEVVEEEVKEEVKVVLTDKVMQVVFTVVAILIRAEVTIMTGGVKWDHTVVTIKEDILTEVATKTEVTNSSLEVIRSSPAGWGMHLHLVTINKVIMEGNVIDINVLGLQMTRKLRLRINVRLFS